MRLLIVLAVVLLPLGVGVAPSAAQLVSVQCCAVQADLERIGECLTGPEERDEPPQCPTAVQCVLGFGVDSGLTPALCDPDAKDATFPSQASCDGWSSSGEVITTCLARDAGFASLFDVSDNEGDGDVDLYDLVVFQNGYSVVLKQVQSDAVLASVECCLVGPVAASLSACLSGPNQTAIPTSCTAVSRCVFGFSDAIELGDQLYEFCRNEIGEPDGELLTFCSGWSAASVPVAFTCQTSPPVTFGFYVVADVDGDEDVDLADFAFFQTDWAEPSNKK